MLDELEAILSDVMGRAARDAPAPRPPARQALPALFRARTGLEQYAAAHPRDPEGWRLLSRAEEALFQFPPALTHLEEAIRLSPAPDAADTERRARLAAAVREERASPLDARCEAELLAYLAEALGDAPCDRTLNRTAHWLSRWTGGCPLGAGPLLARIRRRYGACDCEVLDTLAGSAA